MSEPTRMRVSRISARAAERPGDRVGTARARRAAGAPADGGVPDAGRRGALQGAPLPEAHRALPRGPVRGAGRRSRGGGHGDHPSAFRLRSRHPHLRRDHPGRLVDLARAGRGLAVRRGHRRPPGLSRPRAGPGALCRSAGAGVGAGPEGPGDGRDDERLRRRQARDERAGHTTTAWSRARSTTRRSRCSSAWASSFGGS